MSPRLRSQYALAKGFGAILVVAMGCLTPLSTVHAQENAPNADTASLGKQELADKQATLLKVMLSRPDDLDVAFEYATISSLLGDYEAAISTFERMLIYAPGLPRVQLELGVLYFRLGSLDAARHYFDSALAAPNVPPEVEARVKTYVAAIDDQEDPADFSASIIAGVRYQTNANASPGGRRVTLSGGNFLLDDTSTGREDTNAFVAGNIHGAYDLGAQGDLLEADLLFYTSRYSDVVRLDTGLAELTVGPSFNLKRFEIDNARAGVYAILSGVRLNHANYNGALGVGTRFSAQPDPKTQVTGKVEFRRRWFNDTAEYSTVSDRNGYFTRFAGKISRQLTGAFTARTLLLADFEEAKTDWNQSWEVGVGLGGTYRFDSPIESLPFTWSFDLEAGYIYRDYAAADPVVSATESEYDHEGWMRAVLSVPLRQDVALGLTGELRRQYSNYDLATYTNASAMISLLKTF